MWEKVKKYSSVIYDRLFNNKITSILGTVIVLYAILFVKDYDNMAVIITLGSSLLFFRDDV